MHKKDSTTKNKSWEMCVGGDAHSSVPNCRALSEEFLSALYQVVSWNKRFLNEPRVFPTIPATVSKKIPSAHGGARKITQHITSLVLKIQKLKIIELCYRLLVP